MILAIVGSVDLLPHQLMTADWIIRCALIADRPQKVISGGAEGIDTLAEKVTLELAFCAFEAFYPRHRRWAPDGFRDRNILIAEECTHLLCIRSQQSKTYGSGWTEEYAKDLGKVTRPVVLPL